MDNHIEFKCTGVMHNGAECVEIQISASGDMARYRSTTRYVMRDAEVINGRWQPIRYNKKGEAYIHSYKALRLYLHNFLRIY